MSNDTNFVWTDELVLDFTQKVLDRWGGNTKQEKLEDFKKSKQLPNKDYEILECENKVGYLTHKYIQNACKEKGCPIWSVRRLSDNEVFSVGDKISNNGGGIYTEERIEKFDMEGSMLKVCMEEGGFYMLKDITKAKKRIPLFSIEQIEQIISIVRQQLKIHDQNK